MSSRRLILYVVALYAVMFLAVGSVVFGLIHLKGQVDQIEVSSGIKNAAHQDSPCQPQSIWHTFKLHNTSGSHNLFLEPIEARYSNRQLQWHSHYPFVVDYVIEKHHGGSLTNAGFTSPSQVGQVQIAPDVTEVTICQAIGTVACPAGNVPVTFLLNGQFKTENPAAASLIRNHRLKVKPDGGVEWDLYSTGYATGLVFSDTGNHIYLLNYDGTQAGQEQLEKSPAQVFFCLRSSAVTVDITDNPFKIIGAVFDKYLTWHNLLIAGIVVFTLIGLFMLVRDPHRVRR